MRCDWNVEVLEGMNSCVIHVASVQHPGTVALVSVAHMIQLT